MENIWTETKQPVFPDEAETVMVQVRLPNTAEVRGELSGMVGEVYCCPGARYHEIEYSYWTIWMPPEIEVKDKDILAWTTLPDRDTGV